MSNTILTKQALTPSLHMHDQHIAALSVIITLMLAKQAYIGKVKIFNEAEPVCLQFCFPTFCHVHDQSHKYDCKKTLPCSVLLQSKCLNTKLHKNSIAS